MANEASRGRAPETEAARRRARLMRRFIVPSVIGVMLFMIPFPLNGTWTIAVKVIADLIGMALADVLPWLCVAILTVSSIGSIACLALPKKFEGHPLLEEAFKTSLVWVVIRTVGAVFVWLTVLGIRAGDEYTGILHMITCADDGGFVLSDLLTVLVVIFAIAGMLLPLLLDFGLLEFIGALFTRFMRPLFKIPGRGAVDCVTSWIGDGTLGVMLTCNQYEGGYYSAREASIIATTFSAVSITFSIVVLAQVDLMQYFGVYYLLICLVGIVCAIIVPRIPPLSLKKDTYMVEGKAMPETIPDEYPTAFDYAVDLAIGRASEFRGMRQFMHNGLKNALGMWFGVLPCVMAIGTLALLLANNTQIFEILGVPFLPLLEFLDVPEAAAASKTMIVGFTDMFTPSVIAAESIASPMTRFIVAVISVTQLLYLSEVGGLILGSKIPVNLLELFLIFLERTIISLLIVCPIAHLFF